MTDARLPSRWLNDHRMLGLTPRQWQTFTRCLMWAVQQRTDGHVPTAAFAAIPGAHKADAPALVRADVWLKVSDGWRVLDFEDTQTTRSQLEADAERKRNSRAAKRMEDAAARLASVGRPKDATRTSEGRDADVPADGARQGKERRGDDSAARREGPWTGPVEQMGNRLNEQRRS